MEAHFFLLGLILLLRKVLETLVCQALVTSSVILKKVALTRKAAFWFLTFLSVRSSQLLLETILQWALKNLNNLMATHKHNLLLYFYILFYLPYSVGRLPYTYFSELNLHLYFSSSLHKYLPRPKVVSLLLLGLWKILLLPKRPVPIVKLPWIPEKN